MRYLLTSLILALSLPAFGATQTRTSSFAYDPNTGLLIQEVIEPDNAALRRQTDYTYDSFGNKTSVTVSGADIVTRTSTTTYDANGQFPISSANALGHTETRQYDARFGTVVSLTGPNGLTTTWSYDGFGRKTLETRADTTQTTVAYNASDANCPGAAYSVTTTSSGAPSSGTCYDTLNRETRSYAQGFDGTWVYKDTQYDSLGRVYQASRPYYAGGTPKWTTYAYDSIGRIYQATEPDSSQTTTGYNGLTTTLTDANGNTTTRIKNSQGQLTQVTDAKGGITSYSYDPFGNLTQTTDAKNNITTLAYDIRGRKTGMIDPDMGSWTYQYNVLGELTQQTDAKNQITTMTYDKLGRMLTRGEPDLTSTWTYDTATKGIGKLASVTAANGYVRSYTYDSLGRQSTVTSFIGRDYTLTTTYDAYGRPDSITYPQARFTGGIAFATQNVYTANGHLYKVVNKANPTILYWQGNAKDAEGHVTQDLLGNGLTTTRQYYEDTGRLYGITVGADSSVQNDWYGYDMVGNLAWRLEADQVFEWQDFTYDELNRLLSKTGATTQTYQYDSIGNITYKSDQGFYTYGTKPHAVAQVAGATFTNNYAYDSNGNLTSGAGRTVTWNSFNMVSRITQGSATLSFVYDADHSRVQEVTPTATITYVNPRLDSGQHFERVVNNNGVIEFKNYIYAGGIPVGVYTNRSNGVNDTKYFHTDHLGSIAVVTNESGAVVARYSYDPFGNRTTVAGDPLATEHGFTGHETLVEVGLVNMNGRVYDPSLARFMSADPNIQAPGNGQSFNRYSYVLNNPLSYTDPTGFSWWTKFRDNVLKPVVVIAVAWETGGLISSSAWATCTATGAAWGTAAATAASFAAASATGTLLNGGSVSDAIHAAAVGGVVGAITGGVAGQFGPTWGTNKFVSMTATSTALARLQGVDGSKAFRDTFISNLASVGWEAAKGETDRLKLAACASDAAGERCGYNSEGLLNTGGTRGVVEYAGSQPSNPFIRSILGFIGGTGMGREGYGPGEIDGHSYNEDGLFGRFINRVSKVHDFFNEWDYNKQGLRIEGNLWSEAGMNLYSFAGMPLAGVVTLRAMQADYVPMYVGNRHGN